VYRPASSVPDHSDEGLARSDGAAGADTSERKLCPVRGSAAISRSLHASRFAALLRREAALVTLVAFWLALLIVALPQELVQDSWLTLLSGREVVQHGLPTADQLTVWTRGAHWVDQQWLAQLAFYGLYALGGIRAAMLAHVAALTAMVGIGVVAARRLGASQTSVVLVALACLGIAPWSMQLRAQTFAQVLFVGLLWLLAADSRSPSRRVFLSLPLLALWANVHGTVVFGALLVVLRGLTALVAALRGRGSGARALLLIVAPVGCIFVSPYGLALAGYYHRLLANPTLRSFIDEWGPSTPSHKTLLFFLLAAVTIWLLGRYRDRLTGFEQLALVFTLVGGVTAIRSIIWFGLAALVLLPLLVDPLLERVPRPRFARVGALALSVLILAGGTAAFGATRPDAWYMRAWPTGAKRSLVRAVSCDRSLRVLADDRYADWLLWEEPRLRGRVAYDVRFELFSRRDFLALSAYRNRIGPGWLEAARGYGVVFFDPDRQLGVERGLLASGRLHRVYRDGRVSVLASARAGAC
jgi:hypothetical protein